jgi:hypothetical protein
MLSIYGYVLFCTDKPKVQSYIPQCSYFTFTSLMNTVFKYHTFVVKLDITLANTNITIYAPIVYTVPCIMFWIRAYPLRGQVRGGWALEIESILGPVK